MASKNRGFVIAGIVFALAVALSGCGSLRLYSNARDKQGETTKTAWSQVDLKALIATERKNLKELLDAELDTQGKLAVAIRDQRLSAMLLSSSTSAGLIMPLREKLGDLTSNPDQWADLLSSRATIERKLAGLYRDYRRYKIPEPSCEAITSKEEEAAKDLDKWIKDHPKAKKAVVLLGALQSHKKDCENALTKKDEWKRLVDTDKGDLPLAIQRLEADEKELESRRDGHGSLRKAFVLASKEYDKAVADASSSPSFRTEKRKQLEAVVNALEKAPEPYSTKLLSEEKLSSLDAFLKVISETKSGEDPPADASNSARAVVLFSNWMDETKASRTEARKLLTAPLLLQKNHELLKLEAASRDIEAQEAVIRIDKAIIDVLVLQVVQLKQALEDLSTIEKKYGTKTLLETFSTATADEKIALYGAIAQYLDALSRLDAKRYRLEYSRLAAQHERALAYAEVNAKQWESLIDGTVDQLSAYGSGGIKPEHITNILNTLGILWIGAGVN